MMQMTGAGSITQRLRSGLAPFRRLDDRALAVLRIVLGLVLLLDLRRGWLLADDWLALQAYEQWPLPIGVGDAATNLRCALGLGAIIAVALIAGWRTRTIVPLAWLVACSYQYASRYTVDYHDAALCQLLLWGMALPLGQRWSVDARDPRRTGRPPEWLSSLAATGLLATICWIYLSTFLAKDGAAWWSEGIGVRLAIADQAVARPAGAWALAVFPDALFRLLTWSTMAVELAAPLLILSTRPWARRWACFLLLGLHFGMWCLMDLGSFPLVMMGAAAAVWLPATRAEVSVSAPTVPPSSPHFPRWPSMLLATLFALNVLLALDDERQRRWPVEPDTPVARWLRRGHTFLSAEPVWSMYAPEPWRFSGWWVGVGETTTGQIIDPITGRAPTLSSPGTGQSLLRWSYLWYPPSSSGPDPVPGLADSGSVPESFGTADGYLHFLLRRTQASDGTPTLKWLALIYVYRRLDPPTHRTWPLLSRLWPPDLSVSRVARALPARLYRVDVDSLGSATWQPTLVEPSQEAGRL